MLALAELADAYQRRFGPEGDEKRREVSQTIVRFHFTYPNIICKIFGLIGHVPKNIILAPRNEQVLSATCSLIAVSITQQETQQAQDQSLVPDWRHLVDQGLRHRGNHAQEAAATAMATMSSLMDCSVLVQR
jgi:hypothetical protein